MNKKIKIEIAVGIIAVIAIIIGGYFWVIGRKVIPMVQPVQVNTNNVNNQQTSTVNVTSEWKTYSSDYGKFEIQYPSDWEAKIGDGLNAKGLILTSPVTKNGMTGSIPSDILGDVDIYTFKSISEIPGAKGAKNLLDYLNTSKVSGADVTKFSEVTFNGEKAYEAVLGGNSLYYSIFIEKNGNIYEILFEQRTSKENLTEIDKKILLTFKFTDNQATVDWKTYTNDQYGYELQYPSTWIVYSENNIISIQPKPEAVGDIAQHLDALQILVKTESNKTLQDIIKENNKNRGTNYASAPLSIGGLSGYKVITNCEGVGCGDPEWYFNKGKNFYYISTVLNNGDIYDKIVSTFKLIK